LVCDRLGVRLALAFALVLSAALAACGRKGPLDPPPGAAIPSPPPSQQAPPGPVPRTFIDPTTPTGQAQPPPVQTTQASPAPQPPKKTFLLDPLLQ
jgi:predicted small lipoprotein YifL